MGWIWGITFFIVTGILGILDPIQAIKYLMENQGLGEEGASVIAFVVGYTFPLTVGFSVIIYSVLTGSHYRYDTRQQILIAAVILWVAGFLAQSFSFGLSPVYGWFPSGPLWIALPVYVLVGYFTSYGFVLMVCALVLGGALAIQVDRWLHGGK